MAVQRPDSPSRKPSGDRNLSDIFGAGRQLVRGTITNEYSNETWIFFFNPNQVQEEYAANYNTQSPMGMSHGYHQYQSGKNTGIAFDIYFNRMLVMRELSGHPLVDAQARFDLAVELGEEGKKFLQSLLYPPEPEPQLSPSEGIIGAAPPACRVELVNVFSMRLRLLTLSFNMQRFDKRNRVMIWTASTRWEEAPISRITMEDVRKLGSFR